MKIIEQHSPTRPVEFFGVTLLIPGEFHFVAVDADGEVYAYEGQPDKFSNWWGGSNMASEWIAEVNLEGMDWRDTCIKIPS